MIPVVITIPLTVGFLAIAAVAGFALFTYVAGQRATRPGGAREDPPTATLIDPTDDPAIRTDRDRSGVPGPPRPRRSGIRQVADQDMSAPTAHRAARTTPRRATTRR